VSDRTNTPSDNPPGAVDVVDGPIGSAWLREPATTDPAGTDKDVLKPIDGAGNESDDKRAIDGAAPVGGERQEPDRVGVDWERTSREA